MRGALLLLLLVLLLGCRGDDNKKDAAAAVSTTTVTSKGSQSSNDTAGLQPSTTTPSPTALPSPNTSIQPTIMQPNTSASNSLLTPTSSLLNTTILSISSAGTVTVRSNPPSTGTLPSAHIPAHTDAQALSPSSTQPPVDLSTPTTNAGAATKVLEVVAASTTIGSADPVVGTPSNSTSTPGVHASSSTTAPAAPTSSKATPAADATSVSRVALVATAAADIPSSAGATTEAGGPASASSSRKPETPETLPDEEETNKSAPQASGTSMGSTTQPRKTTVAATWQYGISQTPFSSSGYPKTSKSPHHHTSVPTKKPWKPPINQIICGNQNETQSSSPAVVLTLNKSNPCDSPLDNSLHNILCKAVKDTFNRSRDNCTVHLSAAGYPADKIAVLGVSVLTSATAEELFKLLNVKKGELLKIGVNNITYPGMLKAEDDEDRLSTPLIIAIVCMACALLLVAAIYGCCHQRVAHRKDQQRLTEELQTMENGYHDNPTLEVMETGSEMLEKKINLNGEVGDCWIVPLHNLTKEELEEEDTHL